MDKKKGALNVTVSIVFNIVLTFAAILERRLLIKYIGNDVNGLNSLFASIIGVLSVAELGIGGAITYCMYRPIVNGDKKTVSALFQLFKRLYLRVGFIITVGGLILTPFLKYFANGYESTDQNIYITFLITLFSVVITYVYSAKTSLINAHKNEYITTTINSAGMILQYVLQIVVLIVSRSFILYLICKIIAVIFQWIVTDLYAKKNYCEICSDIKHTELSHDIKLEVVRSIKAAFMHKIGTVLVNSADSLIISAYIGVQILGKYTNYTTIVTAMFGVITMFFLPLTAVIGHFCVSENKDKVVKYFDFFYIMNICIGFVFFLGFYAVIDDLLVVFFGKNLILDRSVPYIISANYFIQFMRKSTILFRDATGTFYYDRFKPIFEGSLNVILSVILVQRIGIVGVIAATIITNLFVCHIVEPYVLYKHCFKISPVKHYIVRYCSLISIFALMSIQDMLMVSMDNYILNIILNGMISLTISLTVCVILVVLNKETRNTAIDAIHNISMRLGNKRGNRF